MNLDLFAGIGGWSHPAVGFELDRDACATRAAAGLDTIRTDIAGWPLDQLAGKVQGISASPPCQTFSQAGDRDGIEHVDMLCALARRYDPAAHERIDGKTELVLEPLRWTLALRPEWLACEQVPAVLPIWRAVAHALGEYGYSTWCGVLNAADFGVPQTRKRAILLASRVRSVVPPEPTHARDPQPGLFGTLERWVSMADALGWGMTERPGFTACTAGGKRGGFGDGVGGSGARRALLAERSRGAWVLRERQAHGAVRSLDEPAMTTSASADNGNFAWTPREQAQGEWIVRTGANSMVTGRTAVDLQPYERSLTEPAPTVDCKAGSAWTLNTGRDWKPGGTRADAQNIPADQPAPTVSAIAGPQWQILPATTIGCDPRISPRCHHDEGMQGAGAVDVATAMAGGHDDKPVKLSVRDALILQSFPADWPVQGTRTAQFRQIGNAIPVGLARAVLGAVR
jgi:DNA (cytosine-5)-methyltransferase 1